MTTARRIPLVDLDAEISGVKWEHNERTDALWFDCPMCDRSHKHLIPFRMGEASGRKTQSGRLVWAHTGGSTVSDLTLAPSFVSLAASEDLCRLHVFVRGGVLEVLGDSHPPRKASA